MPSPVSHAFDVLIVGSGLAGLSAALLLSQEYRVAILTKRAVREGSSGWAQGGIAAVWDKDDSFAAQHQRAAQQQRRPQVAGKGRGARPHRPGARHPVRTRNGEG